jgi:hypothetical protein
MDADAHAHMVARDGLTGAWGNEIPPTTASVVDKIKGSQSMPAEQSWRAWEVSGERLMAKIGAALDAVLQAGIQPDAVTPTDARTIVHRGHHAFLIAGLEGHDSIMLAVSSN